MLGTEENNTSTPRNINQGYVKVYRSLFSKSWWKKSEYAHLFLHLLLKASHTGYETWLSGKSIRLMPGQLVTGRKKLSDETGIQESKIERILKVFQNEQQIEQQTFNTSRLISITNWSTYQIGEQRIDQQVNNDRTTSEQRVNTIQEGKIMTNNEDKENAAASGIFKIEDCLIIAMRDNRWVEATGVTQEELLIFNDHLVKIAEYQKNPADYKRHFVNWKNKNESQKTPIAGKGGGNLIAELQQEQANRILESIQQL